MVRLIDADALKEEIEFHPTSVSVCMTVAEAKGQTYFKNRCLDDIDNAQTIPAIPMDWMDAQIRWYTSALKSTELKALVLVKQMWEREQEART